MFRPSNPPRVIFQGGGPPPAGGHDPEDIRPSAAPNTVEKKWYTIKIPLYYKASSDAEWLQRGRSTFKVGVLEEGGQRSYKDYVINYHCLPLQPDKAAPNGVICCPLTCRSTLIPQLADSAFEYQKYKFWETQVRVWSKANAATTGTCTVYFNAATFDVPVANSVEIQDDPNIAEITFNSSEKHGYRFPNPGAVQLLSTSSTMGKVFDRNADYGLLTVVHNIQPASLGTQQVDLSQPFGTLEFSMLLSLEEHIPTSFSAEALLVSGQYHLSQDGGSSGGKPAGVTLSSSSPPMSKGTVTGTVCLSEKAPPGAVVLGSLGSRAVWTPSTISRRLLLKDVNAAERIRELCSTRLGVKVEEPVGDFPLSVRNYPNDELSWKGVAAAACSISTSKYEQQLRELGEVSDDSPADGMTIFASAAVPPFQGAQTATGKKICANQSFVVTNKTPCRDDGSAAFPQGGQLYLANSNGDRVVLGNIPIASVHPAAIGSGVQLSENGIDTSWTGYTVLPCANVARQQVVTTKGSAASMAFGQCSESEPGHPLKTAVSATATVGDSKTRVETLSISAASAAASDTTLSTAAPAPASNSIIGKMLTGAFAALSNDVHDPLVQAYLQANPDADLQAPEFFEKAKAWASATCKSIGESLSQKVAALKMKVTGPRNAGEVDIAGQFNALVCPAGAKYRLHIRDEPDVWANAYAHLFPGFTTLQKYSAGAIVDESGKDVHLADALAEGTYINGSLFQKAVCPYVATISFDSAGDPVAASQSLQTSCVTSTCFTGFFATLVDPDYALQRNSMQLLFDKAVMITTIDDSFATTTNIELWNNVAYQKPTLGKSNDTYILKSEYCEASQTKLAWFQEGASLACGAASFTTCWPDRLPDPNGSGLKAVAPGDNVYFFAVVATQNRLTIPIRTSSGAMHVCVYPAPAQLSSLADNEYFQFELAPAGATGAPAGAVTAWKRVKGGDNSKFVLQPYTVESRTLTFNTQQI